MAVVPIVELKASLLRSRPPSSRLRTSPALVNPISLVKAPARRRMAALVVPAGKVVVVATKAGICQSIPAPDAPS